MVQIGVLTTYDPVPLDVEEKAKRLGMALAARGAILITGGNGGLMTLVAEAARKAGGLTVGILAIELEDIGPGHHWFNPYNTIKIKTGQTFTSRSSIVVRSSDAVIVVAGGVGTLTEVSIAYNLKKPIVVLKGSGMMADKLPLMFPDGYIDHRHLVKLHFIENPEEAAELAINLAKKAV
ncbi:MAG: TIGR00725 family protein [Candidatus Methanomethyliaceae archaeon]|nr:TIGR00725 family protein [Candidatus Methanomethyliaceae archaeon]